MSNLQSIRARHTLGHSYVADSGGSCDSCGSEWPCDALRLAHELERERCEIQNGRSVLDALRAEHVRVCAELDAARALLVEAEEALGPFATFAAHWRLKPLRGIADAVYAIHPLTEWAAELRLSDCQRALTTGARLRAATSPAPAVEPRLTVTTRGQAPPDEFRRPAAWGMGEATPIDLTDVDISDLTTEDR